mmetsp:Transcript_8868/g.13658  ORF Transcript_8868/g.13658 Transcript_8868/m.13658 type:complete len:85 (+) Transcript_8868:473-727(+)
MRTAILKLQRWWRGTFQLRKVRKLKNAAAPIVQKHLRGYIARQECTRKIYLHKMKCMVSHFEEMDNALKSNLQVLLRSQWLKYK